MTSNVLKCSNCNVVINELLAFIQNKVEVMKDDSIVNLCSTAFSEEEVVKAKKLLFDSIKTDDRNIVRRKQKLNGNIQDMVSLIRRLHPEQMPIFVARDLQRLPPVTFDHVDCTRLLKDVIILQKEIDTIRREYATKMECDSLKKEFIQWKESSLLNNYDNGAQFENKNRRGSYTNRVSFVLDSQDSGPLGMLHLSNKETDVDESIKSKPLKSNELQEQSNMPSPSAGIKTPVTCETQRSISVQYPNVSERQSNNKRDRFDTITEASNSATNAFSDSPVAPECEGEGLREKRGSVPTTDTVANHVDAPAQRSSPRPALVNAAECKQTYAGLVAAGGEWKLSAPDSEWTVMQRNRLRNRFVGMTGKAVTHPRSSFKAADTKIPLFIDNVDKDASIADISQYIFENTQVRVDLQKIVAQRQRPYDSYKVLIPRHKFAVFMNKDLWPDGIIFRKFVDFKSRKTNSNELK